MRSFEFNESQFSDLNTLVRSLLEDENDPRSNSYKRIIIRPKIKWISLIMWIVTFIILIIMTYYLSNIIVKKHIFSMMMVMAFATIYICCTAKFLIIILVRLYQRYAPKSIRMKCRFEPSCSEYMILSINKYGTVKGLIKGIKRLKRCNINNGGFDYP